MSAPVFSVVLFQSTNAALRGEDLAEQAGIPVKLIPVPRQLSSDCGVCLRFFRTDQARMEAMLSAGNVPIDAIEPIN